MKVGYKEFENKLKKIRTYMSQKETNGFLISSQSNMSWLTGGRGFVGINSDFACGQILVTEKDVYLVTSNIEAPRLTAEEIPAELGLILKEFSWTNYGEMFSIINSLVPEGKFMRDGDVGREMWQLRGELTKEECDRYRWLGLNSAKALEQACREAVIGETEFDITGRVSDKLWKLGIEPITILIAVDGRTTQYRHPIPTEKKLEKYAIVSICARKWGLVASATRLFHFGKPSAELTEKVNKVLSIDTCYIAKTRPGAVSGDIFARALELYGAYGYKDEWKMHHQGGLTGYGARDYIAGPNTQHVVGLNQAFAWNPTISGVKAEDTILVLEDGNEIITNTGEYTYVNCECDGKTYLRPGILEL